RWMLAAVVAVIANRRPRRTPADVTVAVAPVDPRRSPRVTRDPAPVAVEPVPVAVVERQPTPSPITRIGPTVIGVHPRSARFIRCEIDAHDCGVRTPDAAVAIDLLPRPVRCESLIDFVVVDGTHRRVRILWRGLL